MSGCATVPREASDLSVKLMGMISSTRDTHIATVHLYFDQKRKQIDDFIDKEWLPDFANNVFAVDAVQKEWLRVVASNDKKQRLDFLVHIGPMLQTKINDQRKKLMAPIDEAETDVVGQLNARYNSMLAANAALTGLLQAHADLGEEQQKIMSALDPGNKLPQALDEVETITAKITEVKDGYEKNSATIDKALQTIKNIKL